MTQGRGGADEFVVARWGPVAQAAGITVGDRERAVAVATRVFADLRRNWRTVSEEGRPAAYVRRRLVEEVRVLERRGGRAETADVDTTDLTHAFDGLPLDDRLAVGFDWTGLLAVETAEALGIATDDVTTRLEDTQERLRTAWNARPDNSGADAPVGTAPMPTWDEAYAGLLESRAHLTDGVEPLGHLDGARARTRRRRWTLVGAGTAALLVTGLGIGVAVVTNRWDPPKQVAARPHVAPTDAAWSNVETWPARGSLAGDPRVKVAIDRQLANAENRILFADQHDGQIEVAVATRPTSSQDSGGYGFDGIQLFTSPSDLAHLAPTSDGPAFRGRVALLRTHGWTQPSALILAPPLQTKAELSEQVAIDPLGRITRTWRTIPLQDGIARVPLKGIPDTTAAQLRISGTTAPLMTWPREPAPDGYDVIMGPCTDSPDACTSAANAEMLKRRVSRLTGIAEKEITVSTSTTAIPTTLVGDFIGPTSGKVSVTVVVQSATLPNKAVVQSSELRYNGESGGGTMSLTFGPVPAAAADARPIVLPVNGGPDSDLVLAVPRATLVQVSNDDGAPRTKRLPVKAGWITIPGLSAVDPSGIVTTWDAKGHRLGSWKFVDLQAPDPLNEGISHDV